MTKSRFLIFIFAAIKASKVIAVASFR
jgi:hypothetical protein